MRRLFAALATASCLACGGGTTMTAPQQYEQNQTQKPVSPKGRIIGRVLDVATRSPLEGVTVTVLGADTAVSPTNADGVFQVDGVVVNSSYTLIFDKAGYVRARTSTSISGSSGNSPLEGSLTSFVQTMNPANGTIVGVLTLPNGNPVANVAVTVDQGLGGSLESVVTTQTGADGTFTLSGLATAPTGFNHTVVASWLDTNGDMLADYGSTSVSGVTVFPGQAARIFMSYGGGVGQRIVASNVIDGEVPAGEDLQFTFSMPLFTGALSGSGTGNRAFTMVHSSGVGSPEIPVEGTFMSPTVVRVRPSLNSLREGEIYTLTMRLRNANTDTGTGTSATFTVPFQVRPAMVMPFTAQVTQLTATNPNPTAPFGPTAFNSNASNITLSFVGVMGAVRYEVYARDTQSNPNYVRIAPDITANGAPRYTQSISPPNAFNNNVQGGPLGGGNRITFAVVPVDAFNQRAPLMSAPTVEVRDTIPPTVAALNNASFLTGVPVDAINDTGGPVEIRIQLNYSEAMDPASMVTFTSSSGQTMSTWRWNSTTSGILTLTVPSGGDATGSFVIRGGRDMAGNDIQSAGDVVGSLGGRRELLQNGEFRTGTSCMITTWSATGTPGPTSVPNNGAVASNPTGCAALLGAPPGSATGSTGVVRITQDLTLPTVMNTLTTLEATARYRPVFAVNANTPGASYVMTCRITNSSDTMTFGTLFSQTVSTATLGQSYTASSTVSLNAQATMAVRVLCEVENTSAMNIPGFGAMYLDELSVAQVKPGAF